MDLLDKRTVEGFEVTAWTLGTLEKLAPVISRITTQFEAKNIDLGKIQKRNTTEISRAVLVAIPEVSEVLALSTGKTVDEMRGLDLKTATILVVAVLAMNLEYLKNSFAPVAEMVNQMTRKAE